MKRSILTFVAISALSLTGLSVGSLASEDENRAKRLQMQGTMPLSTIVKTLENKGYTRISEIEFERGRYEIEGRRTDGTYFKIYVDAHTGKFGSDD